MNTLGVLTSSDSRSQGNTEDVSGNLIIELMRDHGYNVVQYEIVPDEAHVISNVLKKWADIDKLDLIVTTGATSLTVRDIMPEATTAVLDKQIPGIAEATLNEHQPNNKDCLVVVSNSGRNAYGIELAITAKSMGCKTVALTSIQHSSNVESRHSSGKRLFELCDIVIDSHVPLGDASMSHPDFKENFGPVSTISTVAIFNAVICRTIEILIENNQQPEVLKSANL